MNSLPLYHSAETQEYQGFTHDPGSDASSGIYVATPTSRWTLRRIAGNGPKTLKYRRKTSSRPGHYSGTDSQGAERAGYSFSTIKNLVQPRFRPNSPAILANWRKSVGEDNANRIVKESQRAGDLLHCALDDVAKGKSISPYPKSMEGYIHALENDILPNLDTASPAVQIPCEGQRIPASEVYVFDFLGGYGGRIDQVISHCGELYLAELKGKREPKTFNSMRDAVVQACCYLKAWDAACETASGIYPLEGIVIAYCYKNGLGDFIPVRYDDLGEYLKEWRDWLEHFYELIEWPTRQQSAA